MEYEVTTEPRGINFGATGAEEILQNIAFIMGTPEFSCPMYRTFAWSPDVDAPLPVAMARTAARITEAIQVLEPRAEVLQVTFNGDGINGVLNPVVRVRIADDSI